MQICVVEYTQNKSHVEVGKNTKTAVVKISNIKKIENCNIEKFIKKLEVLPICCRVIKNYYKYILKNI